MIAKIEREFESFLNLRLYHAGGCRINEIARLKWLPVVDAFRTLVLYPPPKMRALLKQIEEVAIGRGIFQRPVEKGYRDGIPRQSLSRPRPANMGCDETAYL